MAEHTPGPWWAEGPDMFGDYNILHPADTLAVGAAVSNLRLPAEVAANARMFAAGPDLLKVAEMAYAAARMELGEAPAPDFSPQDMLDAASAAIAKATVARIEAA